jgi:hypothetical protein
MSYRFRCLQAATFIQFGLWASGEVDVKNTLTKECDHQQRMIAS